VPAVAGREQGRLTFMKLVKLVLITAALGTLAIYPVHAANLLVKLATVVPDGSTWDKALRQLGDTWRTDTEGRVTLRVYAGGTLGNESTIIKRMNTGQLQAGSFSAVGLAQIDDAFNVFAIPMFYASYAELDFVMDKLTPELDKRLEAKKFKRLNWGLGGWVQIFSKTPVRTVEDVKALKIFTSADDDRMVQWYKNNGFKPQPLAISDLMTSLQTGMIEAIPVTPLSALAFQWYEQTPYMLDLGLAPLVGATIMTTEAWNRISPEDQPKILAACAAMGDRLNADVPRQDGEAIAEMEKRKLTVTKATGDEWRKAAEEFSRSMRGTMVPADIYDLALRERDAYRKTHGDRH
jgi:TRAP-type C4-dicarboxylate transport system substrate-binding protein